MLRDEDESGIGCPVCHRTITTIRVSSTRTKSP
jgi:hypothetical protein